MSNEITKTNELEKRELLKVVGQTLYPGAKTSSVEMVLSYCKAVKIDPMLKPVHIVPMSVKNAITGNYEFRDTIMPGIGHQRILAARSGQYAGISEPEYGEDVTESLSGVNITYPKWCKITVYKLIGGVKYSFSAKELWKENYARQSSKSQAPNSMWLQRPYGQLAKCTEAQALRKTWPEIITSAPTFEEMEGKQYETMKVVKEEKTYSSKADMLADKLREEKNPTVSEDDNVVDMVKEDTLLERTVQRIYDRNGDDGDIMATCGISSMDELEDIHIEALNTLGLRLKSMVA